MRGNTNAPVPGPLIPPDQTPWPIGWEQDEAIDDGHHHIWETCVLAADGERRQRHELVVRCALPIRTGVYDMNDDDRDVLRLISDLDDLLDEAHVFQFNAHVVGHLAVTASRALRHAQQFALYVAIDGRAPVDSPETP